MIDILAGEHLSHVGASRGVAYHCSAAADKSYRLVASHLQSLHERKSHEMTCREAVCGAVKTDIKRGLAVVDHLFDFRLVRHLRDKSARDEFFVNSHSYFSFHFVHKIKKPPHGEPCRGRITAVPPLFTPFGVSGALRSAYNALAARRCISPPCRVPSQRPETLFAGIIQLLLPVTAFKICSHYKPYFKSCQQ